MQSESDSVNERSERFVENCYFMLNRCIYGLYLNVYIY